MVPNFASPAGSFGERVTAPDISAAKTRPSRMNRPGKQKRPSRPLGRTSAVVQGAWTNVFSHLCSIISIRDNNLDNPLPLSRIGPYGLINLSSASERTVDVSEPLGIIVFIVCASIIVHVTKHEWKAMSSRNVRSDCFLSTD